MIILRTHHIKVKDIAGGLGLGGSAGNPRKTSLPTKRPASAAPRAVPQLEKLAGPAYVNIGGDEVRARKLVPSRMEGVQCVQCVDDLTLLGLSLY